MSSYPSPNPVPLDMNQPEAMMSLYRDAVALSNSRSQHVGEKHDYYITLEQLMELMRPFVQLAPWNDPNIRWVCEAHPTKDFEHRLCFSFGAICAGPGMPEDTPENRARGYIQ